MNPVYLCLISLGVLSSGPAFAVAERPNLGLIFDRESNALHEGRWDDRLITKDDFSVRVYNGLTNDNVRTVADLISRSEAHILRLPNFGRSSLQEITLFLGARGLSLKDQTSAQAPAPTVKTIESSLRRVALALQDLEALAQTEQILVLESNAEAQSLWAKINSRMENIRGCERRLGDSAEFGSEAEQSPFRRHGGRN